MAFELDPDADEKQTPAPGAAAPVSAPSAGAPSPTPQASNPKQQQGTGFVSFDQLLSLNAPYAQSQADNMVTGAKSGLNEATKSAEGAGQQFAAEAQAGTSASGYEGPTSAEGRFDPAKAQAAGAAQQAQALATRDGIQALFQAQGQSADAARYNSLFTNQFTQPQVQGLQQDFSQFDQMLQAQQANTQTAVQQGQERSTAMAGEQAAQAQAAQAQAAQAQAAQDQKAEDARWLSDADAWAGSVWKGVNRRSFLQNAEDQTKNWKGDLDAGAGFAVEAFEKRFGPGSYQRYLEAKNRPAAPLSESALRRKNAGF